LIGSWQNLQPSPIFAAPSSATQSTPADFLRKKNTHQTVQLSLADSEKATQTSSTPNKDIDVYCHKP
jgi:hypothetical protein